MNLLTHRSTELFKSRRQLVNGLCLAVVIAAGCGQREVAGPDPAADPKPKPGASSARPSDQLMIASRALHRNDLDAAETAVRRYLVEDPNDATALELAGDIALRRGDNERSVEMYHAAVDQGTPPSETSLEKLAVQLMASGRAFDSVDVLLKRIEQYPNNPQARFDLVGLATMLGLPQVAVPSLQWLAQRGHGDAEILQVLSDPRRVEPDTEMCGKLLARNPDDRRAEYGMALLDAQKMNWHEVLRRLQPVLERHPSFLPAYILYGRGLAELNDFQQIQAWQQRAPATAADSPEYWLVAGIWAELQGQHPEAARAYWEAIRLDPSGYPEVLTRLARSLTQMGRTAEANKISDQIARHAALRDALKTHLERSAQSQAAALRVADAMLQLGRLWEAEGWARLAVSLPNDRLPDIRERYLAIRSKLSVDTPWQLADAMIGSQIELSDLPEVQWVASAKSQGSIERLSSGDIRFQDQAKQRGWIHTCELAPETATEGHWIYQSVGGGVGVIDFDLDGWPDLAAAMLDGKPLQANSSPNRLFRNQAGQFVQCTTAADYLDRGFAQGITIGDFNDDGFADIFDANIGRNRLYQNNGDGTFSEVSSRLGLSGEQWTTSAVIADIDGDAIADLYEVAYCSGRKPYEVECRNPRGLGSCPPLKFEAEQDRVWRGAGDGTLVDATADWMEQSSPGRGLGIVAGMLDEHPGLDLYVANDMTVNHLWSGQADGGTFELLDLGVIRGLGNSGRSLSQASMGIASGDADGDGDLDFFLTHFSDDHNTYYEQVSPGMWVDRSYQVGLAAPSMKLLGFGTEWIDFDNNGTLELIVANGHVDDVDRDDIAYQMPAQLFQRDVDGRWAEQDRKQLGGYFAGEHLGRALASVDADRDGRVDVAITHLYEPVSLLINQTENSGASVSLALKSTGGQRDAIGAVVTAQVGGRTVTGQLTAGDGYMCSNQRRIRFGTGNSREINDVMVTWPAGNQEEFGTLNTGAEYLLIEGSGTAYQWEKP